MSNYKRRFFFSHSCSIYTFTNRVALDKFRYRSFALIAPFAYMRISRCSFETLNNNEMTYKFAKQFILWMTIFRAEKNIKIPRKQIFQEISLSNVNMRYIRCPRNCDYTQASILKRKLKRGLAQVYWRECEHALKSIDVILIELLRVLRLRYRRGRRSNFAYRVVLSVIYCERHYRHYYRRLGLYQETTLVSRLLSHAQQQRGLRIYTQVSAQLKVLQISRCRQQLDHQNS